MRPHQAISISIVDRIIIERAGYQYVAWFTISKWVWISWRWNIIYAMQYLMRKFEKSFYLLLTPILQSTTRIYFHSLDQTRYYWHVSRFASFICKPNRDIRVFHEWTRWLTRRAIISTVLGFCLSMNGTYHVTLYRRTGRAVGFDWFGHVRITHFSIQPMESG